MGVIKADSFLSSTNIVENESAVVNHIKESQPPIKNQISSSTQAPPSSNLAASRGIRYLFKHWTCWVLGCAYRDICLLMNSIGQCFVFCLKAQL